MTENESALHESESHPDYEYFTREGGRKSFVYEDLPPEGEGWVRNIHRGRNGWERFDNHEESYWMRLKVTADTTLPA